MRALTYIRALGADGLREVTEMAVLNANYVRERLKDAFHLPYDAPSMHEVVFDDTHTGETGVHNATSPSG